MIDAHQAVAPSDLAASWSFEPAVLAALVATGIVYARGRTRLGRRIAATAHLARPAAFSGGLAVIAAALLSPIDAAATSLFSGHMVQHLVLMLVAAPLLVFSKPAAALLAGLPGRARDGVRHAATGSLRRPVGLLWHPAIVWGAGTVVLWAWHMPALYEAALSHDALHALEHATFLGTAILFWSVVLGSSSRRGVPRPIAVVVVFATGVQSSALGAVLLFATNPLYPVHAAGARLWERALLEDQQLAGALMWGPPALLYLVTMGWLLVRWFSEMDESSASERALIPAGEIA